MTAPPSRKWPCCIRTKWDIVSVASEALADAVAAVEVDVLALESAEPGRSCGVTSLRGFDGLHGLSLIHPYFVLLRPRATANHSDRLPTTPTATGRAPTAQRSSARRGSRRRSSGSSTSRLAARKRTPAPRRRGLGRTAARQRSEHDRVGSHGDRRTDGGRRSDHPDAPPKTRDVAWHRRVPRRPGRLRPRRG